MLFTHGDLVMNSKCVQLLSNILVVELYHCNVFALPNVMQRKANNEWNVFTVVERLKDLQLIALIKQQMKIY